MQIPEPKEVIYQNGYRWVVKTNFRYREKKLPDGRMERQLLFRDGRPKGKPMIIGARYFERGHDI